MCARAAPLLALALLLAAEAAPPRLHWARQLPPALHLRPGDRLHLACVLRDLVHVAPAPPPAPPPPSRSKVRVRWLRNDQLLPRDTRLQTKKFVGNGTIIFTLELANVTVQDKAYYTCLVLDGKQELRSTCIVNVTDDTLVEPEGRTVPFEILTSSADFNYTATFPSKASELSTITDFVFTDDTSIVSKTTPDNPEPTYLPTRESVEVENQNITSAEPPTLCQIYEGAVCAKFLAGEYIYVPYPITQAALEERLTIAFKVVSYSNEISANCEKYALPSLCFSTFPVCRTPAETNGNFSRHLKEEEDSKMNSISRTARRRRPNRKDDLAVTFENLPPNIKPPDSSSGQLAQSDFIKMIAGDNRISRRTRREMNYRIDTITKEVIEEPIPKLERRPSSNEKKKFSISRDAIPLRRVCRDDCEILENELCAEEYAIAKRHPEIGQKLNLEDCLDLPIESPDCLVVGIEKFVGPEDECFWEAGLHYRGIESQSRSGLPCLKWGRQLKVKIANHPELSGGHNYCRNPGGTEPQPWCFVDVGTKTEMQLCEIPKCSQRIWIYIIVTILIILAVLLACVFICCRCQGSKSDTTAIRNINLPNAGKNIYGNSRLNSPIELSDIGNCQNGTGNPSSSRTNKIITVPQYNLSQIKFLEELGEGAFGKVYKGKLTRESDTILVAVKALKENASHKTQQDFKREIELISELNHDNIVCILGVVLREEPLCMLFEFMALGDLHEFLVSKAPPGGMCLVGAQLLSISHHISAGMEYLAAHHYVHRDLAARNCLVAENMVVKISDFGLSRDIYSSDYYRVQSKSLLPIRWMPPESILYGKFTSESDVWSYGVVLWEIYSYGLQPYYGYSNQEVISMVRGRELLKPPTDCPRAIYNLMKECWNQTPARRPNFTTISNRLNEWINSSIGFLADNSSESSGAHSGQRAPILGGDPRERIPLISHHSSSNGSLSGSIPRKLSTAGSIRSHASTRLMVSSSDVTSSSDNCDIMHQKKSSCGSLLEGQPSSSHGDRRDGKMSAMSQPFAI